MSVFIDYNEFLVKYGADCRAIGISPRQATILAMAMDALQQRTDGGNVYFIPLFPDRSTLNVNDGELHDLMTDEKPYLKWGDSECRCFAITEDGIDFIKSNPRIFCELIPNEV